VPGEALELLDHALQRQRPDTIILERDDHLEDGDQLLADVARIRDVVARHAPDAATGSSADQWESRCRTGD
jgi:uncharacterized protein (UPF0276 family)